MKGEIVGDNYAIELLGITKTFPGMVANDNITLRVKENEIHALLGENGAGKSTLMSILFGAYAADAGIIKIHGKEVNIKDSNVATDLGIGMVHQHFKLVHNYTVTENIVLGREPRRHLFSKKNADVVNPKKGNFSLLNMSYAEKRVQELSDHYGLAVDPKAKIDDITVGQQQRVEILKTLYSNSDIIILDEPTAVLTPQEIDELMIIIRKLQAEGKTIVIITHKLKEIKAVANRCSVLRRGKYIGTVDVDKVSEQELATMMVGRPVTFEIERGQAKPGKLVLEVKNLYAKNSAGAMKLNDCSFSVHEGEIFGIAGVDGNGQSELLAALSGLIHPESGTILFNGVDVTKDSIRSRIEKGIGFIPEDRQKYGLVNDLTIAENASIKDYYTSKFSNKFGVLSYSKMEANAKKLIDEFDIRSSKGASNFAGSLSGGNQQKVIVAREINLSPSLLIIAQPTRGLDVGAIEYIRRRIIKERDSGKAILLVSFELDEIMNLCDRIATISKGTIVGTFKSGEVTARDIGLMMAGVKAKGGH